MIVPAHMRETNYFKLDEVIYLLDKGKVHKCAVLCMNPYSNESIIIERVSDRRRFEIWICSPKIIKQQLLEDFSKSRKLFNDWCKRYNINDIDYHLIKDEIFNSLLTTII